MMQWPSYYTASRLSLEFDFILRCIKLFFWVLGPKEQVDIILAKKVILRVIITEMKA